jgi:hypothetical protein
LEAYLNRADEVYVASFAIYFDDSGTSPNQNIAVAAGWIAPTNAWMQFEIEWDVARKIPGDEFKCMHMTDFVSSLNRNSEFYGKNDLLRKQRIGQRLRQIIMKYAVKGFALGVVKADFDAIVPDALRAQGFENHYTYAIRRVLGMVDTWRQTNMSGEPIEYVFDWLDKKEERRKEIKKIFSWAEGQSEAFIRYGLQKGGYDFRQKELVPPLQAADMFAWTVYRATLNEVTREKIPLLAEETFKDFYLHKNRMFIEGGYNKPQHLVEWVKTKGFSPLPPVSP